MLALLVSLHRIGALSLLPQRLGGSIVPHPVYFYLRSRAS